MNDLEELYVNLNYIFNNERLIKHSIKENIFELDYIKVYVLLLAYLNLCDVPVEIIETCITGKIPEKQFEELYSFLSDKWEEKAKDEIDDIIYAVENGEEL